MHIALIVFNLPERGTYFRAYHFGRSLARRGHQVTLIYTAPVERARFHVDYAEGGRLALVAAPDLLRGSLRSGWDLWGGLARTAWLRAARFDLVHAFECRPTVLLPALAAKYTRQVPLVIDWCDWFGRGGSVEERRGKLQRAVLRPVESFFEENFRTWADATTTINSVLAGRAVALGVPESSITLLPNGCDVSEVGALEPPIAARQALGLPEGIPLIGYAGSIFARDARLLADAFDLVHAARSDARLLVLGHCNIAIEELVRAPQAVLRTGLLEAGVLRRYLRACDIGWVPLCDSGANRGRWPLKISSYMELGLPSITSAVGDLGLFMQRYPVGLAAAPDAADFAARSLELLADGERAAELGANGRRLAETELSWERMTDIVEEVYHACGIVPAAV